MATDTVLNELILQEVTQAEYEQLEKDNLLDENRVYLTPDNSLKGVLFDFKWADHLLNDISWLRGDTFSWHDGEMYKAAYNHLVADFEGTTAETETIGNIEITFYRAEDKHKICLLDQEDKVLELYNKTGVAWYYILDTANKQFKLPRTKFGFTGLRDEVGGYVEAGLPNITGDIVVYTTAGANNSASGAFEMFNGTGSGESYKFSGNNQGYSFDASRSSSVYSKSTTVQSPATQMYLYFYVGCFEKEAIEQTAGIAAEMFNSKADSDLRNIPANYDYVVESQEPTAENGYTWYRKYKSGWVEQGGYMPDTTNAYVTVTLPIEMLDSYYNANVSGLYNSDSNFSAKCFTCSDRTTVSFKFFATNVTTGGTGNTWQVSGMSAQ